MTLGTIIRFQFGGRQAIEAVARSRASFGTGIILVLLTAIPRNYDQTYIRESVLWLAGPLLFSTFSGTFLFAFVYVGFIRSRLESAWTISTAAVWPVFMGLFWMTAPIAWLYAIPVERFLDTYHATQANLTLLGLVALWRVLLMARVFSVLQDVTYHRALLWVLLPATIEVLGVTYVGAMLNPAFGQQLVRGMGGMITSPEGPLIFRAVMTTLQGALVILVAVIILLIGIERGNNVRPFPETAKDRMPVWSLLAMALVWIGIAIPAQSKQYRFITHAKLVHEGHWNESVQYLARFSPADFPASRRIEPDPYDFNVWGELPGIVMELKPTTSEWIRRLYLDRLGVVFKNHRIRIAPHDLVQMFAVLEQIPEVKEWIAANRSQLYKLKNAMEESPPGSSKSEIEEREQQIKRITEILADLGVDYGSLKGSTNELEF